MCQDTVFLDVGALHAGDFFGEVSLLLFECLYICRRDTCLILSASTMFCCMHPFQNMNVDKLLHFIYVWTLLCVCTTYPKTASNLCSKVWTAFSLT